MSIIKSHDITLYGGNDEYEIILRPLSDEHLPYLYKWNSDPQVLYWTEGEDVESYPPEVVHQIYGGISQNPQPHKGKFQFHWKLTKDEYNKGRNAIS